MVSLEELESIDLSKATTEFKIALLEELGFGSDGEFVTKDGERVKDRYTDNEVRLDNMAILPGKVGEVIIIEDGVFSIIHYQEEFGDETV